jgi:hypothetical protein
MSAAGPRTTTRGTARPATGRRLVLAACVSLLVAACGGGGSPDVTATGASGASSSGSDPPEDYQTLMVAYAAESGADPAIDPMTFVAAPGTAAGTGPLSVRHAVGVTPAVQTGPPATPLLGADGASLGITLGQWEKAQGTVSFDCVGSKRRATSTLTGLLPSATYSAFVVHTALDGPGRFTPWGDPAGTTNNFTSSATGTSTVTNALDGCDTNADDIVIIWHSDGMDHGSSPGRIGVDWHTSLIARVP